MTKILKKLFVLYCIIVCSAFGAGYVLAGLEGLGVVPSPPSGWRDK
ncbi:MAG: hypothetical protein ACO3H5_07480 [Candidatus Nanopelagicales bacterium]|jgi:hypothetical protein